jgi:hypothetical protein
MRPSAEADWLHVLLRAFQKALVKPNQRPSRDPFATTPTMRQQAARPAPQAASPGRVQFAVRGFIDDGISPPLVLLEVGDQGSYTVREGDAFHILTEAARTIRVQQVQGSAVHLEVDGVEEAIIVR